MPESNGSAGAAKPSQSAEPGLLPGTRAASMLGGSGVVLWSYTATTFLSALLLFAIQPLFAKMVLPVLGGSPSVWAVAVFFFQAALLVGYCYAHLLIAKAPPRATGYIHLCVCAVALVCLPIGLPNGWSETPPGQPYFWQIGLFAVAIGLPFLAVAANAPLLQAWFTRTGHPHANDPYFLYAASNLGSLIALLAYPFVLEPEFGLKALSRFWAIGFVLLIAAIGGVFLLMLQRAAAADARPSIAPSPAEDAAARPSWPDRLGWVGLALVPSALLTAFTTHVTTDVASAPLLWVLPLSLYLLTFVLVFRERPLIPRPVLLGLHLISVAAALWVLSQTKHEGWGIMALTGVCVFFLSAMVAHRTLYEARPAARYLTEFYLWMALGGALGGLSAALIAPRVFSEVFEYPLLLALSMACRPGVFSVAAMRRAVGSTASLLGYVLPIPASWKSPGLTGQDKERLLMAWLLFAAGLLIIYWVPWAIPRLGIRTADWGTTPVVVGILVAVLLLDIFSPPRQLIAALLVFCAIVWLPSGVKRGEAQRSYFGVYRVQTSGDGQYHTLVHGTTLHGAQRIRNELDELVNDTKPATYYYPGSPMAQTIAVVRERVGEGKGRYGVTGLQQPRVFHLPADLPAAARHRARRRAADHRQGEERELRPDHRRRLLLRCRPRAPDDGGGDPPLPRQGDGEGHRAAAHLQPLSRSRLGAGRHHQEGAGRLRHAHLGRHRGRQLCAVDLDGGAFCQERGGAGAVPPARDGVRAGLGWPQALDGRLFRHPGPVPEQARLQVGDGRVSSALGCGAADGSVLLRLRLARLTQTEVGSGGRRSAQPQVQVVDDPC
jgi:hypothetical protein